MKCLEVRRLLSANPTHRDDALFKHLDECKDCAAYSQQLQKFEHQLEKAVQLEIPESLTERILLNQSTAVRTRRRQLTDLAIAASILLSVSLIIGMLPTSNDDNLQEAVFAHIRAEPEHLTSRQLTSLSDLNRLMYQHGAALSHSVGTINYAGSCDIHHAKGVHIVVDAGGEPVTVLYMPHETLSRSKTIVDDQFQGVILPTERGSVAFLGVDKASVLDVVKRFESALQYF